MSIPFDLRIDLASGEPVISVDDLSLGSVPHFVQGVDINLRIWGIQKIAGLASYIPVTGITLFVALGDILTSTYLTQQATWTPSSDPADPFFEATLPMNVSFTFSGKRSLTTDFGVFFFESATPVGALQKSVKVYKSLYSASSLIVPAGQTALSAEVANATYLKRLIPYSADDPVYFQNKNTGKEVRVYTDDDGSWHADEIT